MSSRSKSAGRTGGIFPEAMWEVPVGGCSQLLLIHFLSNAQALRVQHSGKSFFLSVLVLFLHRLGYPEPAWRYLQPQPFLLLSAFLSNPGVSFLLLFPPATLTIFYPPQLHTDICLHVMESSSSSVSDWAPCHRQTLYEAPH